ncbi:hypothetical protein BGX23_007047 [Mortierella sp. AD031]|nr:hypothetical protein BGX23_007047 [Mortierella sp. AD031]
MATTQYTTPIAEEMQRQFQRDGFFVLRNALEASELEVLRRESDTLINFLISENVNIMTDYGGIIEPISCGYIEPPVSQMFILSKKSYSFVRDMVTEPPDSALPILFEKMPMLANGFLPVETEDDPTCLFNEQYIVKTPHSANISAFEWHQTNGTLLVEPFPRPKDTFAGGYYDPPTQFEDRETYNQYHRNLASHYGTPTNKMTAILQAQNRPALQPPPFTNQKDTEKSIDSLPDDPNEWVCENQLPVLVEVPAGSVVFLSGWVRHCSLGNSSSKFRRAFMPQYSAGKVLTETGGLVSLAVPCSLHEREWVDPREQAQEVEDFGATDDLDFDEDIDMED